MNIGVELAANAECLAEILAVFKNGGPLLGGGLLGACFGILFQHSRTHLRPFDRRTAWATIGATTWIACSAALLGHLVLLLDVAPRSPAVAASVSSLIAIAGTMGGQSTTEARLDGLPGTAWNALTLGMAFANRWLTKRLKQEMFDTVDVWRRFDWHRDGDVGLLYTDMKDWFAGEPPEMRAQLDDCYQRYSAASQRWGTTADPAGQPEQWMSVRMAINDLLRLGYQARCDTIIETHLHPSTRREPPPRSTSSWSN